MALAAPCPALPGAQMPFVGWRASPSCRSRIRPSQAAAVAYVALAAASARQKGGKRKGWRQESEFTAPMEQWRGQTGRGKKGHFHLLDRYIRRIDALLPEDMEDLVRPLSYKPNQEQTTRTLKITFPDEFVKPEGLTEEEVRDFLYPLAAQYIALGWQGEGGAEIYVMFESNEECQSGRKLDGQRFGGRLAQVRFSVDNKFRRVMEDLGQWPMSGDREPSAPMSEESAEELHVVSDGSGTA